MSDLSKEEFIDAFQFRAVEVGFSLGNFQRVGLSALMVVSSLDESAGLLEGGWRVIEQRDGEYLMGLTGSNISNGSKKNNNKR